MKTELARRRLLAALVTTPVVPALLPDLSQSQSPEKPWWLGNGMPQEGKDTPKIAMIINLHNGATDDVIRGLLQTGCTHALSSIPGIPWEIDQLQPLVDKLKAGGVTLGNLMISGFPNSIYGRPGRDEQIEKVRHSLQAAGKVGIPVVEYNFYAHRAVEGYFEELGRGGAVLTGSDYELMKDLPPLANEGAHSLSEM